MDEAQTIAAWLRQRDGETDAAWIERLDAVFRPQEEWPDYATADRIGERLRKRFEARIKAAESST